MICAAIFLSIQCPKGQNGVALNEVKPLARDTQ